MDVLARIRKPKEASAPQGGVVPQGEEPPKGGRKRGGKRRVSISTVVMTIVLVVGLGIILYPTFSDWWNSFHQSRVIQNYTEAVEQTDKKTIDAMLKAAAEYNKGLVSDAGRFTMNDEERAEYLSLLNLSGDGVMGFITIPSIGVNLPIYHGVDETHLQVAVGHIEGSSLPVGGKSTHTVVSAHRGLPSAKLFTDLDKVVEGDIFMFTILDEVLTYQVDQIRIVEPSNMSDLAIEKDKDYATLVTCTPYGINTHRILVRGHRIENISEATTVAAGAIQIPPYVVVPAVAIPLLFIYLLITLIRYRLRRPELDTQKALETVRKEAMGEDVLQDDVNKNGTDESTGEKEIGNDGTERRAHEAQDQ